MDPRAQALAEITAPGAPFEVVVDDVLGVPLPVFAQRQRNLREMLTSSTRFGDAGYFTLGDHTLTFADNLARTASVAAALRDLCGVQKGDRVAIFSANRPDYAVLFWAAVSTGAIVTAYNGWWTVDEVRHATDLTSPTIVFGDAPRLARVAQIDLGATVVEFEQEFETLAGYAPSAELPATPIDEDDPAVILFTSGTTGRSKGAVVSHRGLVGFVQVNFCNAAVKARAAQLQGVAPAPSTSGPNITLLTSPMFHVSGMFAGIILGLASGMRLVLREGRFDEEDVLRIIEREQITSWAPVGGLGMRVIDHPRFSDYDTSSIRMISFGGGPTSPASRAKIQRAFPSIGNNMANGYGSSETVAAVSSNSGAEYDALPEAAGRINPTCEVQIWDERDRPVPDGVEGEVHARSAYNMLRYWNDPDATRKTLKGDGWLATGDIGRIEEGMLTINSRARDMIIRGGENIYPIELERRLDAHPGVAESSVVGVDHAVLGQVVKAIVVPVTGVDLATADLARWVAETLAPYKVPTVWELRAEALPRNASGKVLKTVLVGEAPAPPDDHVA
ncbi:MAG TPA: class I adenylate-forming enzyme family protein [Acidimicrobiales bacterium]|nr:class I adenylate-forming enzyme family protein [Acidimicrobiales bacterium]